MTPTEYGEEVLIEQPAIALFKELDYETANCFNESFGSYSTLGRENPGEVVLKAQLEEAIKILRQHRSLDTLLFDLEIDRLHKESVRREIAEEERQRSLPPNSPPDTSIP